MVSVLVVLCGDAVGVRGEIVELGGPVVPVVASAAASAI
jgi:hypothetical protein